MRPLEVALECLQNAQLEPALEALLEAWRESKKHPAIADAVDLLSATLTEKEKPIRAVGATPAKDAWNAAAASKRAAVIGRLLEAIEDNAERYRQLDALAAMPADPRMATAARAWLNERRVARNRRKAFFGRVVTLVEHTGDVRLVPFLSELLKLENRSLAVQRYGTETWQALTRVAEKLAKTKVPDLDREATKTLAAIAKLVRAPAPKPSAGTAADEEALLVRIYEDPLDDEALSVLADLLQQRGDPRGELIAMQLARYGTDKRPTTAEKKLLQQWGRSLLGPLDAALQKQGVVFERGFVTQGRYVGGREGSRTVGAREWSLVTHLDVSMAATHPEGSAKLLLSMPRLRHVTGLDPHLDFGALRRAERALPWVTVGFVVHYWIHLVQIHREASEVFPAARKLVVRARNDGMLHVNADDLLALLEQWPQVEDFELDAEPDLVFGIRSDERGQELARLVLDGPMGVLTLEGDRLDFETRFCTDDVTNLLADMVRRLGLRHVTLRGAKKPLVKGDYFFQEYMRMSLVPLRQALDAAGGTLTVVS